MATDSPYRFKFRRVAATGKAEGILASKGVITGNEAVLGDERIDLSGLVRASVFQKRVILQFDGGEDATEVIEIASNDVEDVAAMFNQVASGNRERARRAATPPDSQAGLRFENCPACDSRIDLTDFPVTPQVWCFYCTRVVSLDTPLSPADRRLSACEGCGSWTESLSYLSFVFYFLFVVYGWRSQRYWRCRACMRSEAWLMLAKNLVFILGVPFAIYLVVRAHLFGRAVEGRFAGLTSATVTAHRGTVADAVDKLSAIELRLGGDAHMAVARGVVYAQARDWKSASVAFQDALTYCGNFGPAYVRLADAFRRCGRRDELLALRRAWDDDAGIAEDLKTAR